MKRRNFLKALATVAASTQAGRAAAVELETGADSRITDIKYFEFPLPEKLAYRCMLEFKRKGKTISYAILADNIVFKTTQDRQNAIIKGAIPTIRRAEKRVYA